MANPGERGPGMERWGQCHRMGMRCQEHHQFMLARMVSNPSFRERLGVTPEQAQKIRTQTFDFRKTQIRNRAELQVKRLELHELLSVDNPDRAAIDNKLQEISAVQLAGKKSAIDFHLAMRAARHTRSTAEASANEERVLPACWPRPRRAARSKRRRTFP